MSDLVLTLQNWGHGFSIAGIVGTFAGYFPSFAALLSAIWFLIQIYESRTFQHWYRNRVQLHQAKKLAKYRAAEKVMQAKIDALEKVRVAKVEARETIAVAVNEAEKLVVHETAAAKANLPRI